MKYFKIIFLIVLFQNSSYASPYVYDYKKDTCEQYSLGPSEYLFVNDNDCVLNYQVGDFYYDARFYSTFQVETALKCINNTNVWDGFRLTFDTANPLVCGNGTTLNKATCSCDNVTADANTTSTSTSSNNTLGLSNEGFNFLLALEGLLFGFVFMFFTVDAFSKVGGKR